MDGLFVRIKSNILDCLKKLSRRCKFYIRRQSSIVITDALPADVQQKIVTAIARSHGIDDFKIENDLAVSRDGDGYIGVLESICIKDKNSNGNLHIVIKSASASEKLRTHFPIKNSFLKEIYMYEKVLPDFTRFQEEYKIAKPFNSYAKLYGAITDEYRECLILKNLKADGYSMVDRREPLSPNHLRLVLETYGKFHAVSLAMKRLDRERFVKTTAKVRKNTLMEFQQELEKRLSNTKTYDVELLFASTMDALKDHPLLLEAIQNGIENILKSISNVQNYGDHEHAVITHADCWSANILFKYEDRAHPTIPSRVTLIDWQDSYLTHPLSDISYFFYISAGKEDLFRYKEYLKIYYNELSSHLTAFGLEPKSVYSFDDLQEQWNEFNLFGFTMVLAKLHQTVFHTKTHNIEDMTESEKPVLSLNGIKLTNRYRKRMIDLVEFLIDQDLL